MFEQLRTFLAYVKICIRYYIVFDSCGLETVTEVDAEP